MFPSPSQDNLSPALTKISTIRSSRSADVNCSGYILRHKAASDGEAPRSPNGAGGAEPFEVHEVNVEGVPSVGKEVKSEITFF